jgi:hypothetical protein
MTKKRIRKIIIWGIIAILVILYINTCMITKIPDEFLRINELEPINAYKFYQRSDDSYYSIKYEITPNQLLSIFFKRSMFWPTINDDVILMHGNLFSEEKHEILYIKEISYNYNGKNNIIIENKRIDIPIDGYDILLDENRIPAIIDGKNLYAVRINHGDFLKLKDLVFDFTPKHSGQEKEIELIQIYSFDNEIWYEEKYRFKVIIGGKKIDLNRPMLNFAGLFI